MSARDKARAMILEELETIRADRARFTFCDRLMARCMGIALRRKARKW